MMAGIVVVLLVLIGVILAQCGHSYATISVGAAQNELGNDSTVVILDVRAESEYRGELGHLAGALLIPLENLGQRVEELEPYKTKTVIVYCRAGRRSANAAEFLAQRGFHVYNLEGGILKWRDAGFPVINEQGR
jgi:rhodanese-related sulfurtransferase